MKTTTTRTPTPHPTPPTPVTYEDFDRWVKTLWADDHPDRPRHYTRHADGWVVNVSWDEADAYARAQGSRLLKSEEWDPRVSELAGIYEWVGDTRETCALRGGSWYHPAEPLRSAIRFRYPADRRSDIVGFRVAVASPSTQGEPQ